MAINVRTDEDAPVPPLETPESFPFPYAKPYGIQVDLMRVVFEAIENGKIAIVSRPEYGCHDGEGVDSILIRLNRQRVPESLLRF